MCLPSELTNGERKDPPRNRAARKPWFLVGLLVLLLLSACAAQNVVEATPPPSPTPILHTITPTVTPSPTQTATPTITAVSALQALAATPVADDQRSGTPALSPDSIAEPPAKFMEFTRTPGPRFESDVLFLAGDKLERWRPDTKQVIVLANDVVEFAANESNVKIGLLQSNNITANGTQLFSLSVFNYRNKSMVPLLEETSRMYNLKLSPDGQWLSYATLEDQGMLRIISTDGSNRTQQIGQCTQLQRRACGANVAWSPDSRMVLYSDDLGLWRGEVGREDPMQLFPNALEIKDPRGDENPVEVIFEDLDWSPAGRYAMAWVQVRNSGVRWKAVIDTRVVRLAELPGTYELLSRNTNAIWTSDGSLFMVHGGRAAENIQPYAQIWRIRPTDKDLLILEAAFPLKFEDAFVGPAQSVRVSDTSPAWLHQLYENFYAFGLTLPDSVNTLTLVTFDTFNSVLRPIANLPVQSTGIFWSPTYSGVLVTGQQEKLLYIGLDGSQPVDLRPVLGRDTCCFSWLPPAPVSH